MHPNPDPSVQVEGNVRLELEAPCYVRHHSEAPGRRLETEGSLRVQQTQPLFWDSVRSNNSYFTPEAVHSVSDVLLPRLLQKVGARARVTQLKYLVL